MFHRSASSSMSLIIRRFSLAIGLVTLPLCGPARADLLEEFRTEYPAAASRVEAAYSHVRMLTKETSRNEAGKVTLVTENEYLHDGNLIRGVVEVLQSVDAATPVGIVKAFGGSASEYFEVAKKNQSSQFMIESFRSTSNFDLITRNLCRPVFSPYCIFEMRIVDYLQKPEVKVLSATNAQFDGKPVINVLTAWKPSAEPPMHYRFYFEPRTWTLLGWTGHAHPEDPKASFIQYRLNYEAATEPVKLSQLESWGEYPSRPGVKVGSTLYEIKSVKFGAIPEEEFTLAALGVEGPAAIGSRSSRFPWLVILNVLIFGGLGIWFAILSVRRRRRADTKHVATARS